MSQPLAGHRAVVAGGASGIGRAIAQALSARGAKVIVADVNAAPRRWQEMADAFARQAPWERNGDRYEVNRVIAAVTTEMKGERK